MNSIAFIAAASALVIQEKEINESGPHYIHLKGRRAGIIAKLLSVLGIDATTSFDVYEDRIEFSTGSVFGRTTECIPMTAVCNVGTGYVKPAALLFAGIILILSAIPAIISTGSKWAGLVPLVLGVLTLVGFFLGKTMMVYARSTGADLDVISFKRSVIENQRIDDDEAKRIVDIMNKLVIKANAR